MLVDWVELGLVSVQYRAELIDFVGVGDEVVEVKESARGVESHQPHNPITSVVEQEWQAGLTVNLTINQQCEVVLTQHTVGDENISVVEFVISSSDNELIATILVEVILSVIIINSYIQQSPLQHLL